MVCFEEMSTWNTHHMAGCSHKICVECAGKMQSMSDESDYTISEISDSDEEFDLEDIEFYDTNGTRIQIVPRQLEPDFQAVAVQEAADQVQGDEDKEIKLEIKPYPINYTVKYSKEGCTITRVNDFVLQGFQNPMQCPYCRQREPMIYDFEELRFCVPFHTLEWNILERKFYNDRLSSFTMSKGGTTFAFKLSKDGSSLRIMWTEVNTYPFTLPKQSHTYSDFKKLPKKQKDPRAYSRPKRYTKMIR